MSFFKILIFLCPLVIPSIALGCILYCYLIDRCKRTNSHETVNEENKENEDEIMMTTTLETSTVSLLPKYVHADLVINKV